MRKPKQIKILAFKNSDNIRIWMYAITFKNLIPDNLQKKDEWEETLKQFKTVASLQVKMLSHVEHYYLTHQCI